MRIKIRRLQVELRHLTILTFTVLKGQATTPSPRKQKSLTKHRPCIHSYLILENGSENGEARRDVEKLSSCRVVFGANLPLQVGNCLGSILRVGNVRRNENVSFLVVSCFPSPVACSFVSSLVA